MMKKNKLQVTFLLLATCFFFLAPHSLAQTVTPTPTLSVVEKEFLEEAKRQLQSSDSGKIERAEVKNETIALVDDKWDNQDRSARLADKTSPTKFTRLLKKHYHTSEAITSLLVHGAERTAKIQVLDPTGNPIDATIVKRVINEDVSVKIYPPASVRPGKYTIVAKDKYGTVTTQDFMWGVLAINTNKSIYLQGETALISLAVLNEKGEMVCGADVTLLVENENEGFKETLATSEGTIVVNSACKDHKYSNTADYEAKLNLKGVGIYKMTLNATTKNGSYSIVDQFEVRESVPFEVERITATRIYPLDRYVVKMRVKANQDFDGEIIESAPKDFTLFKSSEGAPFDEKKLVSLGSFKYASDGASLHLQKPFVGDFPESLEFGKELESEKMKAQYNEFKLAGHDGVDYSMPEGTEIIAVDDGVIQLAGEGAYGTTVVIKHSWGKSYYGHLSSTLFEAGDNVKKGDKIALSGQSGFVTGPHLHFGIKLENNDINNGYYGKIDPSLFLDSESSVSHDAIQNLIWSVSLKKGDEIVIAYEYDAPDISPQFYLIGPLQFMTSESKTNDDSQINFQNPFVLGASAATENSVVFTEVRRWQIAVDAISIQETVTGSMTTGNSFTLTSWTPGANELVLLAVAVRNETITVTAAGNSLTFVQILDVNDADGQTGITLFRAMGASPSTGQITVTMTGNTSPAVGIATRFSGTDTTGTHGSGAIETTASDDGTPGATDDNDMKVDIATSTANAIAFGAGTHRTSTFTVPGGQTAVSSSPSSINVLAGSGGDSTRGSTFYQTVTSPTTVTVGGDDDVSGAGQDWALIAASIKPAVSAPTLDQLMRHGNWFSGGVEQTFTF